MSSTDFVTRLRAILVTNWPQKLGSLLIAAVIWWFVAVNESPQTLVSITVPIEVEGLRDDSVATGLPSSVVVSVQGPSMLIDRVQRDSVVAILDLAGLSGEFEQRITVLIPQGVELLGVSPADVIGSIEPLASREVAALAVLHIEAQQDVVLSTAIEPESATVSGLASTVSQVASVIVPVTSREDGSFVRAWAADADGLPVQGVAVSPDSFRVTVTPVPVLASRTVPVVLLPPVAPGFSVTARLDVPEVTLVGPPSSLDTIDSVVADVNMDSLTLETGVHVAPVTLTLPEDTVAVRPLSATIRLTQAGIVE
mgnify:CR=1 FL=1